MPGAGPGAPPRKAEAAALVLEAGADPAHRRARPEAPFQLLLEAVDRLVVRHDDVRAVADPQVRRGMPAGSDLLDLLEELPRLHDDPVPDHVQGPLAQDAGR